MTSSAITAGSRRNLVAGPSLSWVLWDHVTSLHTLESIAMDMADIAVLLHMNSIG